MNQNGKRIVIIGLSITSSWGNGHATTYRGLVRELSALGNSVLFLEYDAPWYCENRDFAESEYCQIELYKNDDELRQHWAKDVRDADVVVVGSYVHNGNQIGDWVLDTAHGVAAFYDIDTPVTLTNLQAGTCGYLAKSQINRYDLYLSFSGGPTLDRLERQFGSPMARPLYCSFDPTQYYPEPTPLRWDLGYLGTYSDDRQPTLDLLMMEPARSWESGRFIVAGPQYPGGIVWPKNVCRAEHLPPSDHRAFYNSQRFTLNVTRADMKAAGYSPSVRLFEAAACGVPIISDYWSGIDEIFTPGEEILISSSSAQTLTYLTELSDTDRKAIGERAYRRVASAHSAANRALELLQYLHEAARQKGGSSMSLTT